MVWNHMLTKQTDTFHGGFAPKWKGPYQVVQQVWTVYWIKAYIIHFKDHKEQIPLASVAGQLGPAAATVDSKEDGV